VRAAAAIAAFLALLAGLPFVVTAPWVMTIALFTLMYAVLASAWNLVGGYAGYPSLGHAAFFGLGAYTEAIWFEHHGIGSGLAPFAVLPLVGLAVAAAGRLDVLQRHHGQIEHRHDEPERIDDHDRHDEYSSHRTGAPGAGLAE